MAKRVYTKKGDVYEIKIDDTTKRYMQFIGLDWKNCFRKKKYLSKIKQ